MKFGVTLTRLFSRWASHSNNHTKFPHYITNKNIWIYLQIISETSTSFSVLRLQPDQYNERKFYLTDEKNKFHGLIKDGSLGKSRNIYLF